MSDWMPSLERWINSRGELQAAVEFTAAKTGFQPALVEKDFGVRSCSDGFMRRGIVRSCSKAAPCLARRMSLSTA